jgi:hypothetical protein
MSPQDASRLLELSDDAALEQIEERFNALRARLEDKIAKAPTPGLKSKYRESLDEITAAFEALTLAADSSALPVLKREANDGRPPGAGASLPRGFEAQAPASRPSAHRSGREFAVVAVIAVAVLGAGGWWVIKTRAENAENARVAAMARAETDRKSAVEKAEAERKAEEIRIAAEAKRKAEEEDKARLAAAAQAEQSRREKVLTATRVQMAEARVTWTSFEDESRRAERDAAEARSERRALRNATTEESARAAAVEAAASAYAEWTATQLASHPVRRSLARLDALLNARDAEGAEAEAQELQRALQQLHQDINEAQRTLRSTTGSLQLTASPGIFAWEVRDAFGRTQRGQTPATVEELGVGQAAVRLSRDGWPVRDEVVTIRRNAVTTLAVDHPMGRLVLKTDFAEVTFLVVDALGRRFSGTVPAQLDEVSGGNAQVTFSVKGRTIADHSVLVAAGESTSIVARIPPAGGIITANVGNAIVFEDGIELGPVPLALKDRQPGKVVFEVRAPRHHPARLEATFEPGETARLQATLEPFSERDSVAARVSPYRGRWVSQPPGDEFTISNDGLTLHHHTSSVMFETKQPQTIQLVDEKAGLISVPHRLGGQLVLRLVDERIELHWGGAVFRDGKWELVIGTYTGSKRVSLEEGVLVFEKKKPIRIYTRRN